VWAWEGVRSVNVSCQKHLYTLLDYLVVTLQSWQPDAHDSTVQSDSLLKLGYLLLFFIRASSQHSLQGDLPGRKETKGMSFKVEHGFITGFYSRTVLLYTFKLKRVEIDNDTNTTIY
jgi:hypothetical protein